MAIEIIVPTLGESVSDATVARWIKTSGDNVAADEPVVELDSQSTTFAIGLSSFSGDAVGGLIWLLTEPIHVVNTDTSSSNVVLGGGTVACLT